MRNKNILSLVQSSVLLAMVIVFQTLGSKLPAINQYFVGSVVNATLLLAAYLCGTFYGTAVGVLTPLTALLVGQLKPALAPFIPFIIIGNAILTISFGLLNKKGSIGKYFGIALGAVLKFAFLYYSALKLIYIFNVGIPEKAKQSLSVAMGISQLITAAIGGAIALVLIQILFKKIRISNEIGSAS